MRRITPLTLVALLLLQTLTMGLAAPASAIEARGGANDDWLVSQLTIGNASTSAEVWTQSDGTTVEYLFEGDSIEISMEIQRGGSSFSGKSSAAMLQIVHPIGYVMETFTWTSGDLIGGQKASETFVWTPSAAHSFSTRPQTTSPVVSSSKQWLTKTQTVMTEMKTICWKRRSLLLS